MTPRRSWIAATAAAVVVLEPASRPPPLRRSAATAAPASTAGWRASSARPRRRASRPAPSRPRLDGVSYDPTVVRLDRSQRSFKLSFEEFYARRVGPAAHPPRPGPDAHAPRHARSHRAALRRAGGDHHRHLGPRDQLRRRQQRQVLDHPLARHAGLRLPPLAVLHRPSARRHAHRRARRPDARAAARRLGRRDRPHAVPALRLLQVCGRFRRRRAPRPRCAACPTCWPPPPTSSKATAGRPGQGWEPGSANYAVIKDWNRAEVYQRTISVMATRLQETRGSAPRS